MNEYFSSNERQNDIFSLLQRQGRISVAEIVSRYAISEATARRDLEALSEDGRVVRVHGGALPVGKQSAELSILQREQEQADEKRRIGEAAAAFVQDGETIFLGSGSTTLEVARHLQNRQTLTVITNSLPVMNMLAGASGITLISLGGILRPSELSFIGHITEQALAEVNAIKVLIGIYAINIEHGLTSDYLPETMTDRAILRSGREVYVLADHTKVNRLATAFLAPVTCIHTFITDSNTPAVFISDLKQRGITVHIA